MVCYAESKQEQTEIETQEIVDTLEKILVVTNTDFERAIIKHLLIVLVNV